MIQLEFNALLGDKTRLQIMAVLATSSEAIDFNALVGATQISKGNLSSHIRKLEEGGLVEVTKEFVDRKPKTSYSCTALGKRELKHYLSSIEKAFKQMKK